NMWCLLVLTKPLERLMGRLATFLIYILTGVGASLLSLAWNPTGISAGASGAIFGIAGVLISFFYFARLDLPRERIKSILGWVVRFAAMNLVIGFFIKIINNMAHLGGLITGLVLGILLAIVHRAPAEERAIRRFQALAGMAVLLVALFPVLIKARLSVAEFGRGELASVRNDYPAAIGHLQKSIALQPKEAIVHGALGYALAGSGRYAE